MAANVVLKTLPDVTVGTAAVAIFTAPYPRVSKIIFSVPAANTGTIAVGDANVTATQGAHFFASGSLQIRELEASAGNGGGSLLIGLEFLYAISSAASQKLKVSYLEVT